MCIRDSPRFAQLFDMLLPLLVFVGLGVALAGAIYAEITPWVCLLYTSRCV